MAVIELCICGSGQRSSAYRRRRLEILLQATAAPHPSPVSQLPPHAVAAFSWTNARQLSGDQASPMYRRRYAWSPRPPILMGSHRAGECHVKPLARLSELRGSHRWRVWACGSLQFACFVRAPLLVSRWNPPGRVSEGICGSCGGLAGGGRRGEAVCRGGSARTEGCSPAGPSCSASLQHFIDRDACGRWTPHRHRHAHSTGVK